MSCHGNSAKGPKQSFLGFMLYNRLWFDRNLFGLTVGGGKINNPGRYLVLLPPINGANATSGTPYFTENPGDKFKAWDVSTTFDCMPSQYITCGWSTTIAPPMCLTSRVRVGLHLREETRVHRDRLCPGSHRICATARTG